MDKSYYLFSDGELHRNDNTILLIKKDGEKVTIPVETVYDIYSFGDLTFNSDFLEFLGTKSICLHFFNYYGNYSGSFYPREKVVSGDLVVKQVEHYQNNQKRIFLARSFVRGAADNISRNLKYYNSRGRELQSVIDSVEGYMAMLDGLTDVSAIMGIEGNIHRAYYEAWDDILNNRYEFTKRVKQPPDNIVNTLISFINTMIYARTLTEIYKTQLNPSISYLHEPSRKRFSLALDISEVFKPLLSDRLIFRLLNKNMVTGNDFYEADFFLRMKDSTIKTIIKAVDDEMRETVMHRTLKRNISYRNLIRAEAYKLIRHLIGDKEYAPFKIWW